MPDEATEQPWVIRQELLEDGIVHILTVQGDIFERDLGSSKASHRFFGQLNLTALIRGLNRASGPLLAEFNAKALEEMDYSRPHRLFQAEANIPESALVGAIRLLHAYYFIVKPSDNGYVMTHLAPDLIESIGPKHLELPTTALLDLESLSEHFESGENFCCEKVVWKLSKEDSRIQRHLEKQADQG